ncbi:hypothetical protein [Xanthomonas arboricola]|uniref:hypothetical protein n=1 Tax=Xanthomonas arboricola TaxID=56448 RepID=UPI00130E915B|nr:hypothetical protein [Xanthomonas arboricola]
MKAERGISLVRAFKNAGWMAAGAVITFGALGFIGPINFGKDAPAWVQAVMSVAALVGAVFIPRWLDAKKRADGADQYMIFTHHLLEKTEKLKEELEDDASRNGLQMWGHSAEWLSVAEGAKELALSNLPHPKYLGVWLQIREMAIRISDYYGGSLNGGDPHDLFDDIVLDGYLFRLRNLYNELVEIDVDVRGNRGYTKVANKDE